MTEKAFIRDDGTRYRALEVVITPALLANDETLAAWVRMHLEQAGAVILRMMPADSADACLCLPFKVYPDCPVHGSTVPAGDV